jgi:hypothetical protein
LRPVLFKQRWLYFLQERHMLDSHSPHAAANRLLVCIGIILRVAVYRVPENGFDSVGYCCKPLRTLVWDDSRSTERAGGRNITRVQRFPVHRISVTGSTTEKKVCSFFCVEACCWIQSQTLKESDKEQLDGYRGHPSRRRWTDLGARWRVDERQMDVGRDQTQTNSGRLMSRCFRSFQEAPWPAPLDSYWQDNSGIKKRPWIRTTAFQQKM